MPPQSDPKLPLRYDVENAAERSPLPTVSRDILYAFARRMQQGSTLIMLQHQPSLSTLAKSAGWSKRHVQRGLDYLERLGIITRTRPSKHLQRTEHRRTAYVVHYEALLELGTGSPKSARDAQSLGLGPPRRKPRAKKSAELGTDSPEARDTAAHVQISPEPPDHTDPEIAFIRGHITERTGRSVSEQQAAEIRAVILARPGAQDQKPLGYIRRVLALDRHPEKWLEPPVPQ
jgi:hypothetical protein